MAIPPEPGILSLVAFNFVVASLSVSAMLPLGLYLLVLGNIYIWAPWAVVNDPESRTAVGRFVLAFLAAFAGWLTPYFISFFWAGAKIMEFPGCWQPGVNRLTSFVNGAIIILALAWNALYEWFGIVTIIGIYGPATAIFSTEQIIADVSSWALLSIFILVPFIGIWRDSARSGYLYGRRGSHDGGGMYSQIKGGEQQNMMPTHQHHPYKPWIRHEVRGPYFFIYFFILGGILITYLAGIPLRYVTGLVSPAGEDLYAQYITSGILVFYSFICTAIAYAWREQALPRSTRVVPSVKVI